MRILGIECTAHTFGVGWSDGENIIHFNDMYRPPPGQGFIPRELGEHHAKVAPNLLRELLTQVKGFENVDGFAFSQGPGIGQALQVGATIVRYLSLKTGKPVFGVNHCAAHLEIGVKTAGIDDPLFVYASGGNTQIIVRMKRRKKYWYRVLGETLDMGIGNAFDVFARKIGLRNGADLEKIAREGKYVQLPYTVKGMNLTFSGLLTAAEKMLSIYSKEDVAYSFMHNAFAMVTEAVERALCLTKKKGIIVVGGVAKNMMFKTMLNKVADEHGVSFTSPPDEFNGDNGGMIAYTGWLVSKRNKPLSFNKIIPKPYWRIDEVVW